MNSAEGLDKIFRPKSIAVVGATSRPGTIGREILHNLVLSDFKGQIFPVNPSAQFIHSMKCFPSVSDIPDPVDMAVIVVRKDLVLPVVEECGRKGVGGVVVITAGFKEIGAAGAELAGFPGSCGSRASGRGAMGRSARKWSRAWSRSL